MANDDPVFGHGSERSPFYPPEGWTAERCAHRLAALVAATDQNLRTVIAKSSHHIQRTQASVAIDTELIAVSREALARSRGLLHRSLKA